MVYTSSITVGQNICHVKNPQEWGGKMAVKNSWGWCGDRDILFCRTTI